MSEKRDLWVPAVLALGALALLALGGTRGAWLPGIYALLVGLAGALACLPLRLKRGQRRVVGFGAGVALLLVPAAPGVASDLRTFLPWVVAGLALVLPIRALPELGRILLLGLAGLFALLGFLAALDVLPGALSWLLLAAAFHLALQVFASRPRPEPLPPPGPRVAVFGGTFDPFHRGHRVLAEAALKVVDRLLLVPTGQPPHKAEGAERTPFHHRVAMARLGVEGLARTEVLQLEGRRPGPSYTIDTLDVVRSSLPDGARLLLLVGADMYQDLPRWKAWERVAEMATLLVARRPGFDLDPPPEFEGKNVVVETLEASEVDVAARELRARLGRGESVGDLVQPSVQAYIRDHRLYA